MSRLIREKKTRSPFAPKLSPEQEAARLAQSKRDRRRIVEGLIRRAQPETIVNRVNKTPRWAGLRPNRIHPHAAFVGKRERLESRPVALIVGRYLSAEEIKALGGPKVPVKLRKRAARAKRKARATLQTLGYIAGVDLAELAVEVTP